MSPEKSCCVTGHRNIPLDKTDLIQAKLRQAILAAINKGYTHFISGFAAGVDLVFAEIISELKSEYSITLEAAIPYLHRMNTPDKTFHRLIKNCDAVKILADHYSKGCYMARNRYMVNKSTLVIAVYDGRGFGGTAATVKYASTVGCVIDMISL